MDVTCPWVTLNIDLQPWLGIAVIVLGVLGAIGNVALVTSLVFGDLATSLPHVNLLLLVSLAITGLGRALLAGFPFTAPGLFAGGWIFGPNCCQLFAALGQFFFSTQMIILAVLSYERFRDAESCQTRIQELQKKRLYGNPQLVTIACWLYGICWAILPLAQFGSYTCDITHTSCDMDWRLFSTSHSTYIVSFACLSVLAPLGMTAMWLSQAMTIGLQSRKNDPWDPEYIQAQQTKVILIFTSALMLTMLPKAVFVIWVMFAFPSDLYVQIHLQPVLVSLIIICSEISTLLLPSLLFIYDYYVRGSLIRIWRYHYSYHHYSNEN